MNSSVAIHLRVPLAQARVLKKAARLNAEKLATFVRRVAVEAAEADLKEFSETTSLVADVKEAAGL